MTFKKKEKNNEDEKPRHMKIENGLVCVRGFWLSVLSILGMQQQRQQQKL